MVKAATPERLWTEQELADRYRLARGTLKNWRSAGVGPRFVKIGHRALYPESEVIRFEANRRRSGAA